MDVASINVKQGATISLLTDPYLQAAVNLMGGGEWRQTKSQQRAATMADNSCEYAVTTELLHHVQQLKSCLQ